MCQKLSATILNTKEFFIWRQNLFWLSKFIILDMWWLKWANKIGRSANMATICEGGANVTNHILHFKWARVELWICYFLPFHLFRQLIVTKYLCNNIMVFLFNIHDIIVIGDIIVIVAFITSWSIWCQCCFLFSWCLWPSWLHCLHCLHGLHHHHGVHGLAGVPVQRDVQPPGGEQDLSRRRLQQLQQCLHGGLFSCNSNLWYLINLISGQPAHISLWRRPLLWGFWDLDQEIAIGSFFIGPEIGNGRWKCRTTSCQLSNYLLTILTSSPSSPSPSSPSSSSSSFLLLLLDDVRPLFSVLLSSPETRKAETSLD